MNRTILLSLLLGLCIACNTLSADELHYPHYNMQVELAPESGTIKVKGELIIARMDVLSLCSSVTGYYEQDVSERNEACMHDTFNFSTGLLPILDKISGHGMITQNVR